MTGPVLFVDEESSISSEHRSGSAGTGSPERTQSSPCKELQATSPENVSVVIQPSSKHDLENQESGCRGGAHHHSAHLPGKACCSKCANCPSIWTWRTCGLPLGGFFLAFLNSAASSIVYGFFLGYMGLDSYVLMSIAALMKLPQVFLLPFGMLTDCLPIFGYNRKPYFVASWIICGSALLVMSLRPLPAPYYCQNPDGSYDTMRPPCNPSIHADKNWYVFPLFILVAGVQLGCVAGEGLLLEYSQLEPIQCRGKMKAEFTIVTMAGSLVSSAVVGVFLNKKEYLGTFDWGLSFRGFTALCLVLATCLIPISLFCVQEPKKLKRPSCIGHVKSSWNLVKSKGFSTVLLFAFVAQFFNSISTTAGPLVRSQWAGVRVLQQQLFVMGSMLVMMAATWFYKVYLLQTCWRKAIFIATVLVTVSDSIPTFLTIFDVVRNQYFFLGEDILSAVPTTALALIYSLMVIELAEPGQEGLCFGLIGTVQHASLPISTALSNQVFGLFKPSLSKLENYVTDTPAFRTTVALSFALAYGASLLGMCALPLVPRQKADVERRKKEWSPSSIMAILVLEIPTLCLPYGVAVLLLSSQPSTACLRWIGGPGCEHLA
ncbi:unnamed protein product [Symbiodinium natans]|uniref:Uncharacterized protein n=1 Tax=Symbiodinium natans TaxID=878477 RepID=A0A812MN86_9DINO|nr:unnamed protein product [Symbiodinium natans]